MTRISTVVLPTPRDARTDYDARLRALSDAPVITVFQRLASSPKGLTEPEAADRLRNCGDNLVDTGAGSGVRRRAGLAVTSPFVALSACLGVVFVVVGDLRGPVTVAVMVVLSVVLRFWQHTRSDRTVLALRAQVSTTVTVRRRAGDGYPGVEREVPPADLVPGDVVVLRPGDIVPADVRVVAASGLMVDQSALSGEALPVPKRLPPPVELVRRRRRDARPELVDAPSLCFASTSVVGGTATGVVIATGMSTYFGSVAAETSGLRPESSFDRGVHTVGWTLIRFMLVMVPIVLAVNGFVTGDWAQAGMFAAAVAVGLTPEMLPVNHQPGAGSAAALAPAGDRQTAQRHPGPGRDGRAVRGQDRYLDRRPGRLRPQHRPMRAAGLRSRRVRLPRRAFPGRPARPARRGDRRPARRRR
jgi:Mg2+-importing ATPase